MKYVTCTIAALAAVTFASEAMARDQIRIVGSSTVFPFATAVAEQFSQKTEHPAPVVESTGSGGGLKLFCAGIGEQHPDITNSSRRIKLSELEACQNSGAKEITEVKIGYDGIVLASSRNAEPVDLTIPQIYQALAKEVPVNGEITPNPYQKWSEIDPALPDKRIEVLGPPPTSGTRDAFVELVLQEGCQEFEAVKQLPEDRQEQVCATMREDGRFIEAGENDNLIVQKLRTNPDAFGIFGFSFLDQNRDSIQGTVIGGVEPSFENIESGEYPVSRSLYFYVKNAHISVVPGMEAYVEEFLGEDALGEFGYLAERGLIPLAAEELEEESARATAFEPLTKEDLEGSS